MVEAVRSRSLTERMLGAAMLDADVYEEVEADRDATGQAALVVGIVAVASAIGAAGGEGAGVFMALVGAFVSWLVWSGLTYLVGTKLFGGTADWGELLRTLGFAQSPGVLLVVGFVPVLGWLVVPVVWIWQLVAGVVAIRQALDFDTGKAILTAVVAYLPILLMKIAIAVFAFGTALLFGFLAR